MKVFDGSKLARFRKSLRSGHKPLLRFLDYVGHPVIVSTSFDALLLMLTLSPSGILSDENAEFLEQSAILRKRTFTLKIDHWVKTRKI